MRTNTIALIVIGIGLLAVYILGLRASANIYSDILKGGGI